MACEDGEEGVVVCGKRARRVPSIQARRSDTPRALIRASCLSLTAMIALTPITIKYSTLSLKVPPRRDVLEIGRAYPPDRCRSSFELRRA